MDMHAQRPTITGWAVITLANDTQVAGYLEGIIDGYLILRCPALPEQRLEKQWNYDPKIHSLSAPDGYVYVGTLFYPAVPEETTIYGPSMVRACRLTNEREVEAVIRRNKPPKYEDVYLRQITEEKLA